MIYKYSFTEYIESEFVTSTLILPPPPPPASLPEFPPWALNKPAPP